MKSWKEEARDYYFDSHMSMNEIEAYTGVSRQSISSFLKNCNGFAEEKERRKSESQDKRKIYKRDKNREYRAAIPMSITGETLRREHELAVMELSHEKYH